MHDSILDNLDKYTAEQLTSYIRQGVVTLDELRQEGLAVNIRHEIEELLKNDPEEDDWQHACDLDTIEAYQNYLDNYPEGNYRSDARRNLQSLQNDQAVQEKDGRRRAHLYLCVQDERAQQTAAVQPAQRQR